MRPPRRLSAWGRTGAPRPAASVPHTLLLLALVWAVVVPMLVGADFLLLRITRVLVAIHIAGERAVVSADGQTLSVPWRALPTGIELVSGSSDLREYQVDGTDNTNTASETPASVAALRSNPYYAFLNWMRSSDLYSRWAGLRQADTAGRTVLSADDVTSGQVYALHASGPTTISVTLERPEAPATLTLIGTTGALALLTVDRNDRTLSLLVFNADGPALTVRAPFFPDQPLPYLAEVVDTVVRVLIWAAVLVFVEVALAVGLERLWRLSRRLALPKVRMEARVDPMSGRLAGATPRAGQSAALERATGRSRVWARLRAASGRLGWWHVSAACLLTLSFTVEIWVALVQFQAQPHILDASAYYFQAKIFASGHLSAPAPSDLAAFQGPFMVAWNNRWFAQYPPATSALLALGMLVHMPWLIEPLLGTAALLGIYVIGCQLYDRGVALLAVGLLVISPFYAYQAASYLSHTVSMTAEVGYLAALVWFVRTHRARALALAGAALGLMFAARELDAVLVGGVSMAWVAWCERRALAVDWRRVLLACACGALTLGCGLALYLAYNAALTGSPLLLPRTIFSPADRYGFGVGVGFYGQHDLAAGFVNLDQQLTSLLIDLFGWPFYLTLALIPIALLRVDGKRQWDVLLAALAGVMIVAQVGYFYHGIYLGPRYLFDTLPALALLSARGLAHMVALGRAATTWAAVRSKAMQATRTAQVAGAVLLCGMLACGLTFYWPRQIALYSDYSGLPASQPLDVGTVYRARFRNALVLTDNWYVYDYVLWPLNDPALTGTVLYAYAPTSEDIDRLQAEYPFRQVYELISDSHGKVQFVRLSR